MSEANNSFPFDMVEINPALSEQVKNYFDEEKSHASTTRFGPKGYLFPKEFETFGRDVYNMELRPSDIFVVTFPKSGTTWTQELVWLVNNNFNYEKAMENLLSTRFHFIELAVHLKPNVLEKIMSDDATRMAIETSLASADKIRSLPSPRFIKSHLPLSLLPPKLLDTCKVVYVAREPRDVAVSFYHHNKWTKLFSGDKDFKSYWNLFKNNLITWSPYFEHVKEAWQLRHHPNMLFLFYEELSKDLAECVRRVAKHFGKEVSEEQIQKICKHLKFDNFKKNKSVNYESFKELGISAKNESFIREGKVGGWRSYFDEEMTAEAERWIEENLRDTDLRFPQ